MRKLMMRKPGLRGFWSLRRSFGMFLLMLTLSSMWSCIPAEEDIDGDPAPRGNVPSEIVGQWVKGAFNMTKFFDYNGKDLGYGYESARALSFTKDGQAEVYIYVHTFDGYCHAEAFTYVKGTATVEGNLLTITATSGKYRGVYSGYCGSTRNDFARDMTREEVKKSVYKLYWSREKRNGKEYLVTRFDPNSDDSSSDFFQRSSW